MAATEAQYLSKISQQGIIQYHRAISTLVERQWNLKDRMRDIDLAFNREQDWTKEHIRARIANDYGDANKIQNITIPVVSPQVKSAVAYQAAVFLSEQPIFPVVAAPEFIDQAMQMQAVFEENSIRGAWSRELLLFFYNGFKYNLAAIEVDWKKVVTAAIETDITFKGGQEGKPKEIIWEGNCLKNWDMYNTYFDTRVIPFEIPTKGDFAGHTELYTRTALKTFINSLDIKIIQNIEAAFNSPSLLGAGDAGQWGSSYYLPQVNPAALINRESNTGVDWDGWLGLVNPNMNGSNINYRGLYEVSTEYVRIIPNEFNMSVPARGTPQVWKFIIVNHTVPIYAERMTNAHEKIPVFFAQPSEDGLGYQTKSLATNAIPFQQVSSALMNAVLAARRRAVTDRVLYDPSRVLEAHINNPNPSAKIPVRPSAYGKPVSESVYQFPFKDDQAGINLQEIQSVVQFGNILNGQNPARQGQFVKGNKTDGQWDATMSNATSNDQMTALLLEDQVFTPMKEVLKTNILQYQKPASIYSPSQEKTVQVDPLVLRQAIINFRVTDGYLPKDKVISGEALKVGMQVIGTSQALAQGYNIAPLFSYIMKTENVNLSPFEKTPPQIMYEQALNNWTMLAQLAIQKGTPFNAPQPIPAQFGFDPNVMNPSMNPDAQRSQQLPVTTPQAE